MAKLLTSPWGAVQDVTVLAEGIRSVTTASHGGIKLDAERQARMPENWRCEGGWYEEDCDWCLPFIIFHADILAYGQPCAVNNILSSRHVEILRDWHPDKFEEWFETALKDSESYIRSHPLNLKGAKLWT